MSFTLTQDATQSLVRDRSMTARQDYVYEGSTKQTYVTGSEAGLGTNRRVVGVGTQISTAAIQAASLVRTRAFGSTSSLIQTVQQVDSLIRSRTMTGTGTQWSSGVYVRLDLPGIPIQVQDYGDPNQWVVQVLTSGAATFKGGLTTASIDIPAAGSTGFHVTTSGETGWGGTNASGGTLHINPTTGDLNIGGNVTLTGTLGKFRTAASGARVELIANTPDYDKVNFYDGVNTGPAQLYASSTGSSATFHLVGNQMTGGGTQPGITLNSATSAPNRWIALTADLVRMSSGVFDLDWWGGTGTGYMDMEHTTATPVATPAAGVTRIYSKADAGSYHLFYKDDGGTEFGPLGSGGGGGGNVATDTIWDLLGDTVYGTGSDTASRLAGNTTTTQKVFAQTGTGTVSAAPAWSTLDLSTATFTGTLAAGRFPALTGDVTTSAGALATTVLQASGAFAFINDESISLTANVNDQAIGANTAVVRLSTNGTDYTVSGFTGGADGRMLKVYNVDTTQTVTLLSNSLSSTNINRIQTPNGADIQLLRNSGVELVYDSTSSCWRASMATALSNSSATTSVSGAAGASGTAGTGSRFDHGHQHASISSGDLHTEYVQESVLSVAGDLPYASGASTWTRLAANATATKKYLQSVSSGNPAWIQVDFADLSGTTNVALLNATNVFTVGPQTISIDTAGHIGLQLNLAPSPTARAIQVTDSDGVQQFALAGSGADILISHYATTSQISARRAEGTNLLPTAVAADSQALTFGMRSYNGSAFVTQDKAQVAFTAAELWSTSAQGTYIDFTTTKKLGTTRTAYWRMTDDGAVRFAEVAAPALPASGFGNVYASSVDSRPHFQDDGGVDNPLTGWEGKYDMGNYTIRSGEYVIAYKNVTVSGNLVIAGDLVITDFPHLGGVT